MSIPTIEALNVIKIFRTGANTPVEITGMDRITLAENQYVVKPKNKNRMTDNANIREFLASFLAQKVGLTLPKPVFVNISQEFVDAQVGSDAWGYSRKA